MPGQQQRVAAAREQQRAQVLAQEQKQQENADWNKFRNNSSEQPQPFSQDGGQQQYQPPTDSTTGGVHSQQQQQEKAQPQYVATASGPVFHAGIVVKAGREEEASSLSFSKGGQMRRQRQEQYPTPKGYGAGVALLSTGFVGLALEAGALAAAAYVTQGSVLPGVMHMLSNSVPLMAGAGVAAALLVACIIAGAVLLHKNKPAKGAWQRSQCVNKGLYNKATYNPATTAAATATTYTPQYNEN